MAASLAVVALLVRLVMNSPTPLPAFETVGQIAKRSGSVLIQAPDRHTALAPPEAAGTLYSGSLIETSADSLLTMRWSGGESYECAWPATRDCGWCRRPRLNCKPVSFMWTVATGTSRMPPGRPWRFEPPPA